MKRLARPQRAIEPEELRATILTLLRLEIESSPAYEWIARAHLARIFAELERQPIAYLVRVGRSRGLAARWLGRLRARRVDAPKQ